MSLGYYFSMQIPLKPYSWASFFYHGNEVLYFWLCIKDEAVTIFTMVLSNVHLTKVPVLRDKIIILHVQC